MIDYGPFTLATPHRTGGAWVAAAAELAGYVPLAGTDFTEPPPAGYRGYVLTLARHPYTWLVSLYRAQSPRNPLPSGLVPRSIMPYSSTEEFVQAYLCQEKGTIDKLHLTYQANSVIRMEDLPWAILEFFGSLGVGRAGLDQIRKLSPTNVLPVDKAVSMKRDVQRAAVVQAELEYCRRYDYW